MLIILFALGLQSCVDDCQTTTTYTYFQPIYETSEAIRQQFEILEPRELQNPGKIYLLGDYLFINERGEGIHLIDNRIPSSPVKLKFINIPGNFDLAAKGNILYADNYIDLLAIDISDLANIRLERRVENVFPLYNNQFGIWAEDGMVFTGWEEQETVEINDNCDNQGGEGMIFFDRVAFPTEALSASVVPGSNSPQGIGGSMARFAIKEDFLYTIDNSQMTVFNISNLGRADTRKCDKHGVGD